MTSPFDKLNDLMKKHKAPDKANVRGERVSNFITDLLRILEAKVEVPDARQMDIYSSIVDMQTDEYLSEEVSQSIQERLADIAIKDPIFAYKALETAVATIKRASAPAVTLPHYEVDEDTYALTTPEDYVDPIEMDPDDLFAKKDEDLTDEEKAEKKHLRKIQRLVGENPNQMEVLEFVKYLQRALNKRQVQALPPTDGTDGSALAAEFDSDPFSDEALSEDEIIASIFSQVASYENSNFDALKIHFEMDIMYRRLISVALKMTDNQIGNIARFMNKIIHYKTSANEYQKELWSRMNRLVRIVKSHDVRSMGLVMPSAFKSLRLSQIIVNQILKETGYVFDASACSSGKLTTCVLAPAEVKAKRSILIAENSTYGDMKKTAEQWYAERDDFMVIGKEDFLKTYWLESDKNVIVILDKALIARISSTNKKVEADTRNHIDAIGIDLLVIDEAHNFKGQQQGNAANTEGKSEDKTTDDAHNNCSYWAQTMALRSKYRLFATATPLLNDFAEITRLLQFLLPVNPTDKNFFHQERLATIVDSSKKIANMMTNAHIIYNAFQSVSIRVPRPEVEYDIKTISNEGIGISASGRLTKNKTTWKKQWSDLVKSLVEEREEQHKQTTGEKKNWGDLERDEIFFPYYLQLMSGEIVDALKQGHQLCFYTNQSLQTHESIRDHILALADKAGVALTEDEVVLANGTTSSKVRRSVKVKFDDGTTSQRTSLAKKIWDKKCRVLITNNVCAVGLDGLQGTDKIAGCGRISRVFLLANSWTEAIQYQFFSRFVRTQGESNDLPEVKFYQPQIHIEVGEDELTRDYCRTQYTSNRILLKKVKADLVIDGCFPKSLQIDRLNEMMTECALSQLASGTHDTEEALQEREEVLDDAIDALECSE